MLTRYDPVFEDIVFDDPQWVKDFIAANTGGAGATPTPARRPLQERSSSELRQLWRAGRISEDEWRGELQARGSSAQGAADEIAKQKTTGVSTAASTRGQLTASEQAAVTALQGSALPSSTTQEGRPASQGTAQQPMATGAGGGALIEGQGANGGTPSAGPGGRTFEQVTGTDYLSQEERAWYLSEARRRSPAASVPLTAAAAAPAPPALGETPVADAGQGFTPVAQQPPLALNAAGLTGANDVAQSAFETARPQNMLAGLGAFGLRPSGDPIADRELLRQAQAYREAQTASPQVQALAEERGISPEGAAQMQWERDTGTKPSQTVTRIGNEFYDAMGMRLVTVGTAGSKPGDATTIRPTTGSTSTSNYADSDIFDDDIYAASGFTGVVNQPTNLHVAEGGQPEHVQVTPLPDPDVPVGPLSWSGAARGRARQPEAVESTDRPMPVGVAGFDQSVSMSDAQRMNLPLSMVNVPIANPAGGDGVGDREARALGIGPERLAAMRRLYPEMGDADILRMMASGPSVPYGGNQSRDAVQGFVSMMLGSARGRRGPGVPAVTAFRQGEGWT